MVEDGTTPEVERNFQKTERVQRKRVEAAEEPLSLVDMLTGNFVWGSVDSKYTRRKGGRVTTNINSGMALMVQSWDFDREGKVSAVQVKRVMGAEMVNIVSLRRGEDGKFVLHEKRTPGSFSAWAKEFNTAKQRMFRKSPQLPETPSPGQGQQ